MHPGGFQLLAIQGAFGAVAEEAVIPPHKNAINHACGRVAHKPPEVGTVFRLAAARPVCVLADYGYIVLVGVFLANIPLALYAKLLLLMAGKSAIDKRSHISTPCPPIGGLFLFAGIFAQCVHVPRRYDTGRQGHNGNTNQRRQHSENTPGG